jgi:hypothetical protein
MPSWLRAACFGLKSAFSLNVSSFVGSRVSGVLGRMVCWKQLYDTQEIFLPETQSRVVFVLLSSTPCRSSWEVSSLHWAAWFFFLVSLSSICLVLYSVIMFSHWPVFSCLTIQYFFVLRFSFMLSYCPVFVLSYLTVQFLSCFAFQLLSCHIVHFLSPLILTKCQYFIQL